MKQVKIFAVGRAKEEPGPAAIGIQVVEDGGKVLFELGESVGNATSEYAEYTAAMKGLQAVVELFPRETTSIKCELCLSNNIVKEQINHESTITHPGLVPFFIEIHNLRVANFPNLTLTHMRREFNKEADRLVNEALDG